MALSVPNEDGLDSETEPPEKVPDGTPIDQYSEVLSEKSGLVAEPPELARKASTLTCGVAVTPDI